MYTAKIQDTEWSIKFAEGDIIINDKAIGHTIEKISPSTYKVFTDSQIHTIEVLQVNEEDKILSMSINGKLKEVELKNDLDLLLERLGLDQMSGSAVQDLKAPMPGMILSIMVKEGQSIQKGDALLILEAMKMENVIKAQGDAVVNKIVVSEKESVEKNQVLIQF